MSIWNQFDRKAQQSRPDEEERFLVKRLKKTRQRNHEFQTA